MRSNGRASQPEGGAPQRGGKWEPSRRRPFPPIFNILRRCPVAQSIRLLGSESPSSSLFHEFLSSRFNIFSVLPQEQGLCGFTSENPLKIAESRKRSPSGLFPQGMIFPCSRAPQRRQISQLGRLQGPRAERPVAPCSITRQKR